VKSDLYYLSHGNLVLSSQRFPSNAPLVKLGTHYKKVSDFQKRIPNIPRILELDHLTITGNVNLGKNVTLRGTVIIVASNSDTIDIPPGSILENVCPRDDPLLTLGGGHWLPAHFGALGGPWNSDWFVTFMLLGATCSKRETFVLRLGQK